MPPTWEQLWPVCTINDLLLSSVRTNKKGLAFPVCYRLQKRTLQFFPQYYVFEERKLRNKLKNKKKKIYVMKKGSLWGSLLQTSIYRNKVQCVLKYVANSLLVTNKAPDANSQFLSLSEWMSISNSIQIK